MLILGCSEKVLDRKTGNVFEEWRNFNQKEVVVSIQVILCWVVFVLGVHNFFREVKLKF